ncbi:sialidase family protein [Thermostilla marina]
MLTLSCSAGFSPIEAGERPDSVDVFISGAEGYFAYRIPAVVTTGTGTVLAFAEGRKHNLLDPGGKNQDIDLVLRRSTDGGRTWTPMQIVEDPGELWSAANPSAVFDHDTNRVWVFYIRCKPGRGSHGARPGTDDACTLARFSDDDGATWSRPIDLTSVARDMTDAEWNITVPGPGGAIQTSKGRLIVPCWRFPPYRAFVLYSDDHGKTWTRGGETPGSTAVDECQVVELSNGKLLLDGRQHGAHRWLFESDDGGEHWSAPRPGVTVTPVMCAIERLSPTGKRLCWTGPEGPGRQNLRILVSDDDGRTFTRPKRIYEGPSAYSDLTTLPDGSIGVLWERGIDRNYQFITFTRLPPDFLSAE